MYNITHELRRVSERCNGNQQDIASLLNDAADRIERLNLVIDDLGKMLGANGPPETTAAIQRLLRQHTAFKCALQTISAGQLSAEACQQTSAKALTGT
jgi:hypothetical protein